MIMKSIKKVVVIFISICNSSAYRSSLDVVAPVTADNVFVFDFNLWHITTGSEDCSLKVRFLTLLA